MQTQSGSAVLIQGDVEPAVDIVAGREDLRAVAAHAACPPFPGRRHGAGPTPEGIAVNTVLVVPKVGFRVVSRTKRAEDADLASSPGAEGM